ncbi:MAG: protease pro-enzyme activation domain-containing protein, partial [Firmicutes bacterium]|nr:protease pro-enzyme activation domain-containing protein [Bacillota bacterium]
MLRKYLHIAAGSVLLASPLALLATSPVAFAAATTTTWSATNTQATTLADATNLGTLPADTPLQIVVGLSLNHPDALRQYIQSISTPGTSTFGDSLTPSEFTATYGPTDAQVQSVTDYLSQAGLSDISVSSNNLLITADGSASQIDTAFNTQLDQFSQAGQTVYANVTPAEVPSSLQGVVAGVLGLNNAARMSLPLAFKSVSTSSLPNYPASYNPQGFWQAYDVGNTPAASGTNIAIFAEGDLTQVVDDLRTEETANDLPQVPLTVVPVGIASPDTSGADEWDLDTQYSTGMAGTVAHLYVYDTTSLTDSDIAREFNAFASQDVAKAGSASFGECEFDAYLDGSMVIDDEIFAEAAAQGQTTFASAGDTGGFCAV